MKRIGIIIGGKSVEHEVSIITGLQILENIDKNKYDPLIIYIDKTGRWLIGETLSNIETYKSKQFNNLTEVIPWKSPGNKSVLCLYPNPEMKQGFFSKKRAKAEVDVVIPATHGTSVEDGVLQGVLETCGVPYGFSDVKASALGMDKVLMKKVFKAEKLPVLPYVWFYRSQYDQNKDQCLIDAESIGYPLIVKPSNLGSSIGIGKARNRAELEQTIEVAFHYDRKIIIEKCLEHPREINCSVLGYENDLKASLCEEPVGWQEYLKFEDKYINNQGGKNGKGTDKRVIPADVSDSISEKIKSLAIQAFKSIDAKGVARIDFLLDGVEIYVNEINTIPGSASFYLWEPSGIKFKDLIESIIDIALKKHKDNSDRIDSYDVDLLNNMSKGIKG
ncbi:MAG: D-alanine--D-alanine ligase [Clostridiales bacterium 38_11]|nr:MAG: D-alanine--D-alanine ligase [Clostridiales bacterium 38_11]HBH13715.1 D-alanine--D-alanine ligase [Clostridiales bacterium]